MRISLCIFFELFFQSFLLPHWGSYVINCSSKILFELYFLNCFQIIFQNLFTKFFLKLSFKNYFQLFFSLFKLCKSHFPYFFKLFFQSFLNCSSKILFNTRTTGKSVYLERPKSKWPKLGRPVFLVLNWFSKILSNCFQSFSNCSSKILVKLVFENSVKLFINNSSEIVY